MKFQIGQYYQHTTGRVICILGQIHTFFHGSCLLAEEDSGALIPVGTPTRSDLAYQLRKQGLSFREIGERMGISSVRARQLYLAAKCKLTREPHWTDGLSVQSANCLNNCNINSREEAMEAYQSGKLRVGNGRPRNYGWKTHKEVAKWLGLPEPQKPSVRVRLAKTCPPCGG